ncbi:MAG: hypothetical protein LBV16_07695 [Elusimicrobiota bacterium]|nr:hypothetical protein [Elusimicrobiota bacterium]
MLNNQINTINPTFVAADICICPSFVRANNNHSLIFKSMLSLSHQNITNWRII